MKFFFFCTETVLSKNNNPPARYFTEVDRQRNLGIANIPVKFCCDGRELMSGLCHGAQLLGNTLEEMGEEAHVYRALLGARCF